MRVHVIFDRTNDFDHDRLAGALRHAIDAANAPIELVPVHTAAITPELIDDLGAGVVIGHGSPFERDDLAEECIRSARDRGVPLVGTWGGFQHVLVEHARNLGGVADAVHAEYGVEGTPIVTLLACSLAATEITVDYTPGSPFERWAGATQGIEATNCNYGLAPEVAHLAEEHGLRVGARDDTGEVRAVWRPDHPFFVGTLYQPQLRSEPQEPHPVLKAFIDAVVATAT